jgi:hypothetical protein
MIRIIIESNYEVYDAVKEAFMAGEPTCANCGAYKRGDVHVCFHPANRHPAPLRNWPCGHERVHPDDELCRWCSP